MPGRKRIPPLTVIHAVGTKFKEDELLKLAKGRRSLNSGGVAIDDDTKRQISSLTKQWSADGDSVFEKIELIVETLREDFEFDRTVVPESENHLQEFMSTRRGGDHLFATVAALMVRELGVQTRFVTGFYVPPNAFDVGAGHSNVTSEDVHCWVEVRLDRNRWFEIEPTPGFRHPSYQPSLWLASKRFFFRNWLKGLTVSLAIAFIYFTRVVWIEILLTGLWWASFPLGIRRKLTLAARIIEMRARALGRARPAAVPTRDWLLGRVTIRSDESRRKAAESFCDLADRLSFGGKKEFTHEGDPEKVVNRFVGAFAMHSLRKQLR